MDENKDDNKKTPEILTAFASAVVGLGAGYGVITATGITAVGMVGGGVGVGAAAGPVGMVGGAVVGLAAYGIYRIFKR